MQPISGLNYGAAQPYYAPNADREIENLKRQKAALEQQLRSETDSSKIKELEKKLERIERTLDQKENRRRQQTEG